MITANLGGGTAKTANLGGGSIITADMGSGASFPTPDRWLDARSSLTISDSINSADATVKGFPVISMKRTAGLSAFYTAFNTDQTGDWTVFILYKRKSGIIESRPTWRLVDYNMNPVLYVRDAPAANFGGDLAIPPAYPAFDWDEVHIAGVKMTGANISSFWNEDLETVINTQGDNIGYPRVAAAASYTDFYALGVFGYAHWLTEAEMDNIRLNGVFPSVNCIFAYPFINAEDYLWWEQFDAVARLGGGSIAEVYHGWTAAGTSYDPPDDPFGVRLDHAACAFNLFHGFSQQGVHQFPYKPDNIKGSGGETDDIEHLPAGVIHNMANSYIDFNPNNHSMNWGTDADKVYSVFNKDNSTIWKASVKTANGGVHYIANDDGNYTLWHVQDELNEDFITTHAQSGHEWHIFCGLRTSGQTITGLTSIAVYKENQG